MPRSPKLLRNLLRVKKRRANQPLKNPRKLTLLSGRNNNKRRRLPYKLNLDNNKRRSERQMMETLQPSRTSFSTRRRTNLPNQSPTKKQRLRKRLKRRR